MTLLGTLLLALGQPIGGGLVPVAMGFLGGSLIDRWRFSKVLEANETDSSNDASS